MSKDRKIFLWGQGHSFQCLASPTGHSFLLRVQKIPKPVELVPAESNQAEGEPNSYTKAPAGGRKRQWSAKTDLYKHFCHWKGAGKLILQVWSSLGNSSTPHLTLKLLHKPLTSRDFLVLGEELSQENLIIILSLSSWATWAAKGSSNHFIFVTSRLLNTLFFAG